MAHAAFPWLTLEGEQKLINFSSEVVAVQPQTHNQQKCGKKPFPATTMNCPWFQPLNHNSAACFDSPFPTTTTNKSHVSETAPLLQKRFPTKAPCLCSFQIITSARSTSFLAIASWLTPRPVSSPGGPGGWFWGSMEPTTKWPVEFRTGLKGLPGGSMDFKGCRWLGRDVKGLERSMWITKLRRRATEDLESIFQTQTLASIPREVAKETRELIPLGGVKPLNSFQV